MVLNAAVQMLREADELKQKILKFKSGTSMLQDRNVWVTQQQLQKVYQKVLVLDLDYALDKKVEQDLWNIGFKQQIEALQAISKDRKNPSRSEGQAMLSWVLQAASGFYLCLLHQICTAFKLDLPFRRRASLVGSVEGWSVSATARAATAAARYIAQHCLVHLGDLHRYRQQLRVAHTFYRHALIVSAHSGQPYNQLALVSWRRGRRLAAVYWHVRSLLVAAPFPPAPANLARTLAAAANENKELPVLPGITTAEKSPSVVPARLLDQRSYVNTLLRALHFIHTMDDLETAGLLVNTLNTSLTSLVATDNFDSMTLIKMSCVSIWLVHWSTEELSLQQESLTDTERLAASLARSLCAGALLALCLCACLCACRQPRPLPPVKVWLQWLTSHPELLSTPEFVSRPQLWAALAQALNKLSEDIADFNGDMYSTLPLPEDEELHGFTPVSSSHEGLNFAERAVWETFADRIPDCMDELSADEREHSDGDSSPAEGAQIQLMNNPELQQQIRAYRLIQLGKKMAQLRPEMMTVSTDSNTSTFTASPLGGDQLITELAELSRAAEAGRREGGEGEEDSDDDRPVPKAPVVISEADFREKVREKRVGILKPQGSLERAREERALASNTQEEPEVDTEIAEELFKCDENKKDASRKPRINIAMAAIMRKQEETNKQVKFVTPPPTPDSLTDCSDATSSKDKPKIIQPKPMKSLANLPIGRKTGGILSLKDKSGYPHLVNIDPEPAKKPEKDEKKEPKSSQSSQNTHHTYPQQKKMDQAEWSGAQMPSYSEPPRFNINKNYGIQNTGINYSPNYQPVGNQGIRLPVVNPKEIDVRSAALQKQTRQDNFQEGHKFNQNYQMSGDKKNFLNDLPPRFANQYRYWQTGQESQDNKFNEDNFSNTLFGNQPPSRTNWMMNQPQDNYQQPPPWWKPDNPPNFAPNYAPPSLNVQNYYNPQMPQTPYPNMYNQYNKDNMAGNYLQPQMPTVQNLVSSQNFNSSLNNFGYTPTVSYDTAMYPQFNKYQPPVKPQYKDMMEMGLGFGSSVVGDNAQRNAMINFKEPMREGLKDRVEVGEPSAESQSQCQSQGNTYSLFSGAPREGAWGGAHAQQSLWSGPGPSPLERLLEQQKQIKPPSEPH